MSWAQKQVWRVFAQPLKIRFLQYIKSSTFISAQHSITTIDELNERIADLSTSLEEFALSSKKNDLVVDKYFEKQRQEELALALANAHSETGKMIYTAVFSI